MTLPPLLLASMMLLAAPTAGPDKAESSTHDTLRQVAAMTPPQQQAWLRELKARLDWANRLTLPPEETARQRDRVAALLQQKDVSFQTLLQLVRERNEREQEAVVQLVQKYRGQVYKTFQGQGPTFTERQEAWYRVWGLWEAAGRPADQRNRLLVWLEGGIRNSMPGKVSPLPPDPQFTAPSEPSARLAGKKATTTKTTTATKTTAATATATKPTEVATKPAEKLKKSVEVTEKPAEISKKNVNRPAETSKKPAEVATKPAEIVKKPAEAVKKAETVINKPVEAVKEPETVSKKPPRLRRNPRRFSKSPPRL